MRVEHSPVALFESVVDSLSVCLRNSYQDDPSSEATIQTSPVMTTYPQHFEQTVRSIGADLLDRYPRLRGPLFWLWDHYRFGYPSLRAMKRTLVDGSPAAPPPFRVVEVNPDHIGYLVEDDGYPLQTFSDATFPNSKFKYAGEVRGGDWDQRDTRFEETDIYRAFRAHFRQGVPWEETDFFARCCGFIDEGITLWGCTSRDAFEQRCQDIDALYEHIREHGYYSKRELLDAEFDTSLNEASATRSQCIYDEVTVCLGREGEFLFFDGRNRLAIAKLLDLDAIPVWIMVRHAHWQALREAIATEPARHSDIPSSLRTHPDLRPLVSEAAL